MRHFLDSVTPYVTLLREGVEPDLFELFERADSQPIPTDFPLTDEDVLAAPLPSNVQAKLFANRNLPEGTLVSVRLNLNGRVTKDGKSYFLQTAHDRTTSGRALGYDIAITVRDATFAVDQRARHLIATKQENKFPMAGVNGKLHLVAPNLTGVEVRFNPMTEHLFLRADDGRAVKSAEEVTVFNTRCFARGKMTYWTEEEAPKPRGEVPTAAKFHTGD